MIIQLREAFQVDGKRLPVQYQISPEEFSQIRGYSFDTPICVDGEFRNRAGIVTLQYTVSCLLHVVCDRCLKPIDREFSYDFSHTVVSSFQNEEDVAVYDTYVVAEHDSLDLNETAISDLLLMLPTKILCQEDCKGLCDICGCNLNESTCDCRK